MTEERKIITEEQWSWGASMIGWTDLEPAQPKDWKGPMCIAPDENGKCIHPYFVGVFDDSPMEEQCIKCSYRKLEE